MTSDTLTKIYAVIIHPAEEGGYWAECPQLAGCFTQGETIQETESNMFEAVNLYLDDNPDSFQYSLLFEVRADA